MPLRDLLSGGPHNPAAANAAHAVASVVANNGINQDAAADAGLVEAVVQLLISASASSASSRHVSFASHQAFGFSTVVHACMHHL